MCRTASARLAGELALDRSVAPTPCLYAAQTARLSRFGGTDMRLFWLYSAVRTVRGAEALTRRVEVPMRSEASAGVEAAGPRFSAADEWRAGWPVVLAALLGITATSMPALCLGPLLKPVTETFGWSRAEFSSGWMLVALLMLVGSPLVGALIDRFGARVIALPGLALCCAGLAGLSLVGPSLPSWYLGMGVLGLGMATGGPFVWLQAVVTRFERARALAMSCVLLGLGVAGATAPLLATVFLERYGFRGVFVGVAAVIFLGAFPFAWLFFYDARDLARRSGGVVRVQASSATKDKYGMTISQAVTTVRFWKLCIVTMMVLAGVGSIYLHFIPMLTDSGVSPIVAAAAMAAIGPAATGGKLACGVLLDRFAVPPVAAVAFAFGALGYALLAYARGEAVFATICLVMIGLASGVGSHVAAYATSRYFGLRAFGAIYGLLSGVGAFASGVSPVLVGLAKDLFGNYQLAMLLLSGGVMLSAILVATLGKYPDFTQRPG